MPAFIEKHDETTFMTTDLKERPPSEVSYDTKDGDEALQLVGEQRTAHFSEEYNFKLRRKLVSSAPVIHLEAT